MLDFPMPIDLDTVTVAELPSGLMLVLFQSTAGMASFNFGISVGQTSETGHTAIWALDTKNLQG